MEFHGSIVPDFRGVSKVIFIESRIALSAICNSQMQNYGSITRKLEVV